MAVFGSFVYGSGIVYGGTAAANTTISKIEFVAKDLIRVIFVGDVVLDDQYYDINNYAITFVGSADTDVNVRRVMAPTTDVKVASYVLLVTDRHAEGTRYSLTASNLTGRNGTTVVAAAKEATGRRTKVDAILSTLPSHYDKRPESVVRNVLTAIGWQDDLIGGSLDEPS